MDFLGSLLSQLSLTLKKILFDTKKKTFWWYRSMGNQQLWEVDLNITIHCDMHIIKYLDQTWEIQHVDPFEKQQSNKLHQ